MLDAGKPGAPGVETASRLVTVCNRDVQAAAEPRQQRAHAGEKSSEAAPQTLEAAPRWVTLFGNAALTRGRP